MVPPVLGDVDRDGYTDILVTSFSGQVALIDGETLTITWQQHFTGYESYRYVNVISIEVILFHRLLESKGG